MWCINILVLKANKKHYSISVQNVFYKVRITCKWHEKSPKLLEDYIAKSTCFIVFSNMPTFMIISVYLSQRPPEAK